jgi:hypothetical protein
MSNNMKKHFFEFSNEDVNGGESFFLTTDADGTQNLTLQSYLNSATFTLGTMPFNPQKLRQLADELEEFLKENQ